MSSIVLERRDIFELINPSALLECSYLVHCISSKIVQGILQRGIVSQIRVVEDTLKQRLPARVAQHPNVHVTVLGSWLFSSVVRIHSNSFHT